MLYEGQLMNTSDIDIFVISNVNHLITTKKSNQNIIIFSWNISGEGEEPSPSFLISW